MELKMLNKDEKKFLDKNIDNYKSLSIVELIEQLEDYMQTKISLKNQGKELTMIENILDKICK